jgi:hypothetical protein
MVQVRMAYGGYICEGCGRICGYVDHDGRCNDCGPLPKEEGERLSADEVAAYHGDRRAAARRERINNRSGGHAAR